MTLRAPARLRARNQLTLPETIVAAAGLAAGDDFIVEVDEDIPDVVHLRRLRSSYAGALRGLYSDVTAYLDRERGSWEDG
jgi:hypothetical protein